MYLASARTTPDTGTGPSRPGRVPGTVVALGAVSLLTDVSAEMVSAFLPLYLIYTLQLGYVQFGLLDGLYTGATTILRLVGGYLADRLGQYKVVAFAGYAMSTASKLVFPLAGGSGLAIGGVLAFDRAGKGLRTAPRDALISLATPAESLGRAFGLHRAMDTVGALFGPLLTFLLLASLGADSGPIFVTSFCFGLIALIVLAAFVPADPRRLPPAPPRAAAQAAPRDPAAPPRAAAQANPPRPATQRPAIRLRSAFGLLRDRRFLRVAGAATVLGLATISDAFVYVVAQKTLDVPVTVLPLLPLGTALVFLLGAYPVGRIADRVGRWPVFVAGHVLLLGVYAALLLPWGGYGVLVAALAVHGLFYAATDGVLMAYAGAVVPEHLRAGGMAVVQTGQALARLLSSVGFGILLSVVTMPTATMIAAALLVAALVAAVLLVGRSGGDQTTINTPDAEKKNEVQP
ncbi:MFS transporter [Actinokineospora sp. PR83]|uniref:MFS transporter n=1 Tax=Actinokineospora sp. PR83 TaxID=2884908 RepID=UPI001F21939D|nr:MFS transporter [Actinokineospora sp. PR83]MCG8915579.1 MFS transporter [Actinokineospora sp. PR83]